MWFKNHIIQRLNNESFLEFSIKSSQYNFVRVLYCTKVLMVVCERLISFLFSNCCFGRKEECGVPGISIITT